MHGNTTYQNILFHILPRVDESEFFPRATLITLIASIKAFALLLFSKSHFHFLNQCENNLLIYLLLTQKSHSALLRRRFHLTSNSSQQMICRWFSCSSKTQDPGGINWLFCSIFLMLSVWKKKIKHVGSEGRAVSDEDFTFGSIDIYWSRMIWNKCERMTLWRFVRVETVTNGWKPQ